MPFRQDFGKVVGSLVVALSIGAAFPLGLVQTATAWVAGFSVAFVALGISAGFRWAVAIGVLLLATAAIVVTYEEPLPKSLSVSGFVAVACVAVLVGADLSFSTRRESQVSPVVVKGLVETHAVLSVFGALGAVTVLAAMLAIDWPGWLFVLPLAVLTAGAAGLAIVAIRYRRMVAARERERRARQSSAPFVHAAPKVHRARHFY